MYDKKLFISVKELKQIFNIKTDSGAWRHYETIRAAVGKKSPQRLTINDICKIEGCTREEILSMLME